MVGQCDKSGLISNRDAWKTRKFPESFAMD